MGQVLDSDGLTGRIETTARQRYLTPGVSLRISDLTDVLGGYATSVVEVDDRQIWVSLPIRRDGMLNLETGQLVSVRFDRPGDAVYLFDTVVADVRYDDAAPFALAMPVSIDRRRHRSDARLSLVLDARYDLGEERDLEAKVVDLSAGGLGLICERELREGDELTVRCTLPCPGPDLRIENAAVIRTCAVYGRTPGGRTLFQYGLRFLDADEDLRERIIASVIWNLTRNPEVL